MILSFAHIALKTTRADVAHLLKLAGYNCILEHSSSDEGARAEGELKKGLYLWENKRGLSIEVICRSKQKLTAPYLYPKIHGVDKTGFDWKEICEIDGKKICTYVNSAMPEFAFIDENAGVDAVFLSPTPRESAEAWIGLGFRLVAESDQISILSIKGMLDRAERRICVMRGDRAVVEGLEDQGFGTCAFLSNSCEKEVSRLSQIGYKTLEVKKVRIKDRNLSVAYMMLPTDEMIEIYSIERGLPVS